MKKRPLFLTVWLLLGILLGFYVIYGYLIRDGNPVGALTNTPRWVSIFYSLVTLGHIIASLLLWNWKKIGFYLSLVLHTITIPVNILVLGPQPIFWTLSGVGIVILYMAMKPVWKEFK